MTLDLSKPFIIAEAGTCHAAPHLEQRFASAMDYVMAAKKAGADAVKFQMFNEGLLPYAVGLPWLRQDMFCWIDGDEHRCERWFRSHMPLEYWRAIKDAAENVDLVFLASVFQHSTVGWLNELGVVATKVASRAGKDFPYDKAPEPFLISLGMYNIKGGLNLTPQNVVELEGRECFYLECEARYPSTLWWSDWVAGFSDHSGTPWRAVDALSRGCKLIEVHFYIDSRDAGPDLPASLNLEQLALVCEARDALKEKICQ